MKIGTNDLRQLDPYFGVYRVSTGSVDGSLEGGDPPSDATEYVFVVWDAEGEVVSVPLPWVDAVWVCRALNHYAGLK